MRLYKNTIVAISIFCIAMAGLEGAVVVYLRALYYPDGFTVVLKIIDLRIFVVEVVRELTTVIMLVVVGYLAGKNLRERFAFFLLSFAIWDIFYYVWLKIFIDWPASILEWDILFLIPITWLGPVLAPVICSITMMVLSVFILRYPQKKISSSIVVLLIVGSLFILYTFMKDYGSLMLNYGFVLDNDFVETAKAVIPQPFSWLIFFLGEVLYVAAIVKYYLQR